MSRRGARIKVMKQKSKTGDDDKRDLSKMFDQITGSCDAERDILIPKINKIYKNIVEYNKLYNILLNFKPFTEQFSDYPFWFDDISGFLKNLVSTTKVDITKNYDNDLDNMELSYYKLDDASLNVFYKDFKDNSFIKKIIITGNNLSAYKNYLDIEKKDVVDDSFIYREPGVTFQPLAFTTMDLKVIWGSFSITDKAKQFIISILKHTYKIGIDTYEIVTSPDVDIKKFSKILIDSISKMKKQIPRCDKAFKIIENSVAMLESNFKNYFRGSVEAGNPSIILESFIMDISTSQKASSPTVAYEFRKIVSFLKANSANNNDPKIKRLFGMLNNQFSALDTEMGVKSKKNDNLDDLDNVDEEIDCMNQESNKKNSSDESLNVNVDDYVKINEADDVDDIDIVNLDINE